MTKLNAQRNTVYSQTITLVVWECSDCGIVYGIPESFADSCRASGRRYYCPNGHSLGWNETDADRLRKKLEAEERRSSSRLAALDQARADRDRAERRVTAMKGVVTKTKKRIAKGLCVRCSHEFPDLAEHMATEHPGYDPDADA